MRLSDMMAMGRVILKHVDHAAQGDSGCALQLAMTAIEEDIVLPCMATQKHFPWTLKLNNCPQCGTRTIVVSIIANHLNDLHRWNLDRIIDWVRSVEPVKAETVESIESTIPFLAETVHQ